MKLEVESEVKLEEIRQIHPSKESGLDLDASEPMILDSTHFLEEVVMVD